MKSTLIDYWLYFYVFCIYFAPLFYMRGLKVSEKCFTIRKALFPLEYLIQLRLEYISDNSRSVVRLGHIIVSILSILGFMPATIPLVYFNESYVDHTPLLMTILFYVMLAPFTFWFQPREHYFKKQDRIKKVDTWRKERKSKKLNKKRR